MNVQTIEALQAEMSLESLTIVDVRTAPEFHAVHAKGAINIPLDEICDERLEALNLSTPIGLICQSGTRAKTACKKLSDSTDIIIIDGGTQAWEDGGHDVIREKKVISLERQVRIAAGLLVFTGVCIGYFIHPAGLLLSGFVGAGLTFAGVTDTCGMAIMLSQCHWNKASKKSSTCTT